MDSRVIDCDVCIVGSGIAGTLVAEKLTSERSVRVVVVEAGSWSTPFAQRMERRARFLAYGENPWVKDHIEDFVTEGAISPSMVVGGWAMHWGGVTPRYSPEDFRLRSLFGVSDDWPIAYEDLEPFYCEAEERIGVSGEAGPPALDSRSRAYPMPPIPLSYNLHRVREWLAPVGIPFWTCPEARNSVPYARRAACLRCDTCSICPTGARYSPDFALRRLLADRRIELLPRTVAHRLVPSARSARIDHLQAVDRDQLDRPIIVRAGTFVLAAGYVWSPHLLLVSRSSRYPAGLANSSGLVGKFVHGHRAMHAEVEVPLQLYPGMFRNQSLYTKHFERGTVGADYVRHDLRIAESDVGRDPRLRESSGRVLLGDALLDDWRRRARGVGSINVRAIFDTLPHRESGIGLDRERRTGLGDPLPQITLRDGEESLRLRRVTEDSIAAAIRSVVSPGGGRVMRFEHIAGQHHPGGGCRMGHDAAHAVTDVDGRTHDLENLFVAGGPTAVTSGCTNSTLTYAALALRTAAAVGRAYPARPDVQAGG